jgi:hypothetical protein
MAVADDVVEDVFGPIDYLVVEFPDGRPTSKGFTLLLDLVGRGEIRVLDAEFIAKDADGRVELVDAATFSDPAIGNFAGASSGLLDAADLRMLGERLSPGAVAVVLVYEELTMLSVVDAWTEEGARHITDGQLTPADIAAALDSSERSKEN